MPLSDQRFVELTHWLKSLRGTDIQVSLISGDASFRRYFRVFDKDKQFIAVDSPPALVPIEPFEKLSDSYANAGLKVPKVISSDHALGFMLQTDLGDEQLLHRLSVDTVETLYTQALGLLPKVAQVEADRQFLSTFDSDFVLRELNIFDEWLLTAHLDYPTSASETSMLDNLYQQLVTNCLEQPQVTMHRDYHSRNIMLCNEELVLIDYQDSVIGPITYDAVSLLRDCYVVWPESQVQSLALSHFTLCQQHQIIDENITFEQYQKWFD